MADDRERDRADDPDRVINSDRVCSDIEEGTELSITGIVRADRQLLYAPLTGQPCVLHITYACVWDRLDFLGQLVSDFTVAARVAFALETPQGAMLIDAEHGNVACPAQSFAPPHREQVRRRLRDLSDRGFSALAAHVVWRLRGSQ